MNLGRRRAALASLWLVAACRSEDECPKRREVSSPSGLVVLSIHDGWGAAKVEDVDLVLMSAAGALLEHAPGRIVHPISVRPCAEGGRCAEAPFNERAGVHWVIQLRTTDLYWDAYTFEFAHELCHVLASSSASDGDAKQRGTRPNRWFEEALCETASLFTLRRLARTWQTSPPVPQWRDYAPAFQKYADAKTEDPARQLPQGITLPAWYRANAAALRDVRFDRPREAIVAGILLPIFEREPSGWDAVSYLNHTHPDAWTDLESLLAAWRHHVPERHRTLVTTIADHFGITLTR